MSVAFTSAALVILAATRAFEPSWLPAPRSLLKHPSIYLANHYRLLLRTLIAQVVIASLLAWGVCLWRYPKSTGESRPHDIVWTVFHQTSRDPSIPVVDLLTTDGVAIRGVLAGFDAAGPVSDRFIALAEPISVRRTDDAALEKLPAGWVRSVVPLDRIAELHVGFAPRSADTQNRLDSWRAWWRLRPRARAHK